MALLKDGMSAAEYHQQTQSDFVQPDASHSTPTNTILDLSYSTSNQKKPRVT